MVRYERNVSQVYLPIIHAIAAAAILAPPPLVIAPPVLLAALCESLGLNLVIADDDDDDDDDDDGATKPVKDKCECIVEDSRCVMSKMYSSMCVEVGIRPAWAGISKQALAAVPPPPPPVLESHPLTIPSTPLVSSNVPDSPAASMAVTDPR